jgi:DNA-binding transcriptional LysR family regulator
MINVQRLRILREVVRHGSMSRAADALYMTPSAISQQMAVLEREAGVPLLERRGRGVRTTDAGALLARHAEEVLAALEAADADLATVREGVAGTLRVCAFPSAARALMIPAIQQLRDRYPQLVVTMEDLEPEESLPMLAAGDLDLVFDYRLGLALEPSDPGIERRLLVTESVNLALPANHPLVGKRVRMADLRDETWVVSRDSSSFLEVVVAAANRAGYVPRIDIHSNDFQVMLAAVGAGLGVTLVTPFGLLTEYPDVHFQPLEDLDLYRHVLAAIRRGTASSPRIAAALEVIVRVARELANATPGVTAP